MLFCLGKYVTYIMFMVYNRHAALCPLSCGYLCVQQGHTSHDINLRFGKVWSLQRFLQCHLFMGRAPPTFGTIRDFSQIILHDDVRCYRQSTDTVYSRKKWNLTWNMTNIAQGTCQSPLCFLFDAFQLEKIIHYEQHQCFKSVSDWQSSLQQRALYQIKPDGFID